MQEDLSDAKRPSIDRALEVLFALGRRRNGAAVTELAAEFGILKGHIHRFLSILENHGLAVQDPASKRYKLGHGVLKLADAALLQSDLRTIARPHLDWLANETGEAIGLWGLLNERYVCLDRVESTELIRMHIALGTTVQLHAGAAGKAMLANMPAEERGRYVAGPLRAYTAHTLTDPTELHAELDRTLTRGYAVSTKEVLMDAFSVAAPIFDASGQVIAAIGFGAPITRYDLLLIERYGELSAQAAKGISRDLGGFAAAAPAPP